MPVPASDPLLGPIARPRAVWSAGGQHLDAQTRATARTVQRQMNVLQPISDLVLASWQLEPDELAARLPATLQPLEINGRAHVSLASFRNRLGRLGLLPIPSYNEVDIRTYVRNEDGETGVFVFSFWVTTLGTAARPLGIPVSREPITCSQGQVDAPGLDVSLSYGVGGHADNLGALDAILGPHPYAYWRHNGRLRRMTGSHRRVLWHRTELRSEPRCGPLITYRVDASAPDLVLYSPDAEFSGHLPSIRLEG